MYICKKEYHWTPSKYASRHKSQIQEVFIRRVPIARKGVKLTPTRQTEYQRTNLIQKSLTTSVVK